MEPSSLIRMAPRVRCPCGSVLLSSSVKKHLTTQKHQQFILLNPQEVESPMIQLPSPPYRHENIRQCVGCRRNYEVEKHLEHVKGEFHREWVRKEIINATLWGSVVSPRVSEDVNTLNSEGVSLFSPEELLDLMMTALTASASIIRVKRPVAIQATPTPEECGICMEDRTEFRQCTTCRNKVCRSCNSQITRCPFCRTAF